MGAHLGEVAGLFAGRDRTMGRIASSLVDVRRDDDLHDRLGGMTLQVWLEHVCRLPGAEARALLGVVDVVERLPAVLVGLCDGRLSWPQVSAICRAGRGVPIARLGELDDLVATAMVEMAQFEPDAIVDDVWQWVDAATPSRLERAERMARESAFVSMQPSLFGGGSLYAHLGAVGFATVAEALDAGAMDAPSVPGDPAGLDASGVDDVVDSLDERRRARTRERGADMARRLVEVCERSLGARPHDDARPARPLLLAALDVEALLDATRTPGWLLHTLAGGRMRVSAATLQRLVDQRGADLRGVVLDDCGQVVGVGRRTRVPPGWLREAIWARDVTVRDPDGSCPIRRADLDHVTAWPHGATDVDNLRPLGRTWHNRKTSTAWTATVAPDGTTTWRHRRHGWALRLAPPRRDLADPPRAGPPRASPPSQPVLAGVS